MDAAFFQQNLLKLLNRQGCFYGKRVANPIRPALPHLRESAKDGIVLRACA